MTRRKSRRENPRCRCTSLLELAGGMRKNLMVLRRAGRRPGSRFLPRFSVPDKLKIPALSPGCAPPCDIARIRNNASGCGLVLIAEKPRVPVLPVAIDFVEGAIVPSDSE